VETRACRGAEIVCTHEQIAQHLDATRPRVSQALKRLERAGRIRCLRGRILWKPL
jgi:DNA-binding MarR family transcriptional regulator